MKNLRLTGGVILIKNKKALSTKLGNAFYYDIILEQASFKDGGRFLTGGGSYGLHHYERIIGT